MEQTKKEKSRSTRTRRASHYARKSQRTYSPEVKLRLDSEIELFRRVTLADILAGPPERSVMQQFFETFCRKIQKCESNLIRLSIRGVPAWLILYEFFRYACTDRALSMGARKFLEPGYWRKVVENAQKLLKQTRNIP